MLSQSGSRFESQFVGYEGDLDDVTHEPLFLSPTPSYADISPQYL